MKKLGGKAITEWNKSKLRNFFDFIRAAIGRPYREFFSEIWQFFKRICRYLIDLILGKLKPNSLSQILFSTTLSWVTISLSLFTIIAIFLAVMAYYFAKSGVKWFVFAWDHGALGIYERVQFHQIWWMILIGVMAFTWAAIRPLAVSRIGRWKGRFWTSLISYQLFLTLSIVLTWRFQSYVLGLKWVIVMALFLLCHFLFISSIAILCNVTTRIPALNRQYIRSTESIIWRENDPIDYIFSKSLYGILVFEMSGNLFDGCIGWMFGKKERWISQTTQLRRKQKIYNALRKYFCRFCHLFSFAWLFDRILGGSYYVMQFEMVLRDLSAQKTAEVWEAMQQEGEVLEKALVERSVLGFFDISSRQPEDKSKLVI